MKIVGCYYILFALPIWVTVAIFAGILSVILVGRDIFEGLMYNVSYASTLGDMGLTIVVLIATTILHEKGAHTLVPQWSQSIVTHIVLLFSCVVFGAIVSVLTLSSRSGRAMDVFHDVIVVPLFLYLAFTLLPLIFMNGTKTEIIAMICFIALWAGLSFFDAKEDRLNQRRWLHNHRSVIEQMK